MNQRLTVQVDADIKNLERGLQRGEKSVNRFGREVNKGEKQVGKFGKTTEVNAVPAMTSFSQVIQDAPYGIRGVANNLQQLTSQMGYLAQSSGGVTGAFKALASSLIGPAGILLAVSVVTSLLVAYGDKLQFAASQTEKLAEATKKYLGEAKAEISQLKILIGIAGDAANSTDVRRAAIEKINDKYSKYLGNLDLERLKTDEVKAAVDRLTKSLITQAKIKGLEDLITEKTTDSAQKLIELDLKKAQSVKKVETQVNNLIKGNDLLNRKLANVSGVNNQIKALEELANSQTDLGQYVRDNSAGLQIALKEYKDFNSELKEIEKNTDAAIAPLVKLQSKFEKDVLGIEVQPTFSQDEVVIEAGKKPEVKVQPTVDTAAIAELNRKIAEAQKEGAFLDQELAFIMPTEDAIGEAGYANNLNAAWATLETQFGEHIDRMNEKGDEFALRQQQHAQMLSQVFMAMGDSIGQALDGGEDAFENFAKSLLKSVSRIIMGLIAQAIGNAIVGASQASVAAGPAAPIVLPGLIAGTTGVVRGAFGSLPTFNDGGIYTGDKMLARLNSGEMILNAAQQNRMFKMLDGRQYAGNSEPIEVVGESRIEGNDIVITYRRTEQRNNRRG